MPGEAFLAQAAYEWTSSSSAIAAETTNLFPGGLLGWVDFFRESLRGTLIEYGYSDRLLWWDVEHVRGNAVVSRVLLQALSNLRCLIAIISSNYLKSDWCTAELREFVRINCERLRQGASVEETAEEILLAYHVEPDFWPEDLCFFGPRAA
jgi:hypothetical protein